MGEGIGEQGWRNWCQNEVHEERNEADLSLSTIGLLT